MEWILASASPRRQDLLQRLGHPFRIIPAEVDERITFSGAPELFPQRLAAEKAHTVGALYPDALVIACDTVVLCSGHILGKPADASEAENMLRALSGSEHTVVTGCCLQSGSSEHCFGEQTKVRFYSLTDEQIAAYIATGEPFDKAGAYGIQGLGALLVSGITGDYFNVVGLPIARLSREIAAFLPDYPEENQHTIF